jgi:hypothetical protein
MSVEFERRWAGTDYLLHGKFCPADQLALVLGETRAELDAHRALLLVAGPRGLLRSLCFFSGPGREVVEGFLRARKIRIYNRLRPPNPDTKTERDYPASGQWLIAQIMRAAERALEDNDRDEQARVLAEGTLEALGPATAWAPARLPRCLDGSRLALALLIQEPQASLLAEEQRGIQTVAIDDRMLELAVMANSTANSRVHHDAITTTRVDEKLDPRTFATADIDVAAAAQGLVELAAEVAGGVMAAYYTADPIEGHLRLQASCGSEEENARFEEEVPLKGARVVAASLERRRPVVCDTAGFEPELEFSFNGGSGRGLVEMATPVPGPLASYLTPPEGVLTVVRIGKARDEPNPFGAYDHAVLRNVALRLALIRSTKNMEIAAMAFSGLAQGAFERYRPQLEAALQARRPTVYADGRRPDAPRGHVPDDLAAAIPMIEAGLARIAEVTASHSATFRAALPYDVDERHGLALVRIAASPARRLTEPIGVQRQSHGGLNWTAALSGMPQYSPVVERDREFLDMKRGTASAISVPVEVEGCVVGVVNLESPVQHNYDGRQATAVTFAEHVALALAGVRLMQAFEVQQRATQIVVRSHDVAKEARVIRELAADLPPSLRGDFDGVADRVHRGARGVRILPDEPAESPGTITQLARRARRLARWEIFDWHEGRQHRARYGPDQARLVVEALRHVFANVKDHAALSAERPRVWIRSGTWGGQRYDIVEILNRTKEHVSTKRAANLYRVPTTRLERNRERTLTGEVPQFGAYLAGLHVRSVGGMVHMRKDGAWHVTITLLIPHPAKQGENNV